MASPPTTWLRIGCLALLALAGCGGLANDPVSTGTVRGRLSEMDPSALVAPVVAPAADALTQRAVIHADGAFELPSLPPGDYSLFVVATAQKVLRVSATVRAGGISDLGLLTPQQGAFIDARLSQPSLAATALVTVEGTPYADQKFALASAQLAIGPLPEGNYEIVARASGTEHRSFSQVGVGERQSVTVSFGAPPSGCTAAGASCPPGLVCASDGSCVACLEDKDCASGLTCHERACVGTPAACSCCSSDDQCGAGDMCLALSERRAICIVPCGSGGSCELGFTCHFGFCIPASDSACPAHDD